MPIPFLTYNYHSVSSKQARRTETKAHQSPQLLLSLWKPL